MWPARGHGQGAGCDAPALGHGPGRPRDLTFLRDQIGRVRKAMRFTMREFDTRERRCIYTTWPGHEGRSGVRWTGTGERQIYHWRFGPRATTRRNLDYYFWGWSSPESIPWGYQVQDGGAVLGFSYHDLICRLAVDGPDDAWQRLQEILAWFAETQAEGGYRAYYEKDPARGTIQGGNVAGGLGLDKEFFESLLVPQVMLYGFLGFAPTPEGFRLRPRLPRDWPALTITRVHLHEVVIDLTARADGTVRVLVDRAADLPLVIELPAGDWQTSTAGAQVNGNRITLPLAPGVIEISPKG